jgi:hypothetical protein
MFAGAPFKPVFGLSGDFDSSIRGASTIVEERRFSAA